MLALAIHVVIAIAAIAVIVASNPQIFRQPTTPKLSVLEAVYYVAGIAATVIGYYFSYRYVTDYSQGTHNAIWGDHGSWKEFIQLGYTNPAASNASQDYTIMSVILHPAAAVPPRRRPAPPGSTRVAVPALDPDHQFSLPVGVLPGDRRASAPSRCGIA